MNNPLLSFGKGLPEYTAIKPEHIQPAIQCLLEKAQKAVDHALAPTTLNTWEDLVEPLEDATENLSRSWGVISHLNSVADTPELRAAHSEMLPEVTAFWTSLGQNLALYQRYKKLSQSESFQILNSAQKKVIQNSLRDFRLGGAELTDNQKQRFSRALTEAENKKVGINVDMNIQRTYLYLNDVIHKHRTNTKTTKTNGRKPATKKASAKKQTA